MNPDRLDSAALERLQDLLCDRAVQGLSPQEQAELERLVFLAGEDDESLDRAAAAAHLAFASILDGSQPKALSSELRAKIVASGRVLVEQARPRAMIPRPSRAATWSGWIAAAAAAVFALAGWWPKLAGGGSGRATLAELRQRLIETERDEISATFRPGPDPGGKRVSGDLVWSPRAQKGFLRFTGLPKNDVSAAQYQLWIFDARQDERYPIDGGVFDIDSETGEAVVAIDARLAVVEPKMFAVTIEKPGGVVVSSRERIVAVAQL